MHQNRLFIPTAIALAVTLHSTSVLAAGFQVNGQSATGLGRAFAGDAVIADNASVMSRNAAGMALFDAPQISVGAIAIKTDVHVKNATYQGRSLADEEIGDTSYVPNIYYVHPINDTFTLGAAIYSNFGTKTEFSDNYTANEFGGLSDLKSVNFGLSGAYRLNEHLSLGLGLDVVTGTGKLKRHKSTIPVIGNNLLNVDAEGTGLGWNIGTVYEVNENTRFGLTYRNSPDIKATGDTMIFAGQKLKGELIMPLPNMAEFSGFHQLNNAFAVHYSVQWIEWDAFDKLATTTNTTLNEYKWKNALHYSIGSTYTLNEDWKIRAGYMYDSSAQDKKTSISVPDSDRQWLSTGFTYAFGQKASLDFGMTYLVGKDVQVNETSGIGTSISATTRADALLYGLQYNYNF